MPSAPQKSSIERFIADLTAVLPDRPSPDVQYAWPGGVRRRSVASLARACGRKQLDRAFRQALAAALKKEGVHCDIRLEYAQLDHGKTLAFCRLPFLPEAEVACGRVGADFGLDLTLPFVVERQDAAGQFPAESTVCEDVMQTFLWLHAADFTGEPITIFARSGKEWGVADLMGIDTIGRIHLFELKKHTVTASVANQLTHYLLAHLFEDPCELLGYWKDKFPAAVLEDVPAYLASAVADERLDILGPRFIAQSEGRDAAGIAAFEKEWDHHLSPGARTMRLLDALRTKGQMRRGLPLDAIPTQDAFLDLARQWRRKLDPLPELDRERPFRLQERLVLWLVGPRVAGDALERIRSWRRAGVDARWLEIDVQPAPASLEWNVRVRREWAPHRTAVVKEKWPLVQAALQKWIDKRPDDRGRCSISLQFYDRRRPSDPGDEGGGLNAECRAMLCAPGRDPAEIVSVSAKNYLRS